jgi:alkylation response protein AidB-like acyl-CoA dehydrogenase
VLLGEICGQAADRGSSQAAACKRYGPQGASGTIFEGTSEIQRMIVGRAVTGLDVR